jgi:FKBP-type peptidyl-prolyl cis-trans isomerase FkpA
MSSKNRKPTVPMFVEPLESRQLLSGVALTPAPVTTAAPSAVTVHRFIVSSPTRLQFFALPATTLMGQPFTLSAKLTCGGLPLRTATIKITDSAGNLVANIVTARSGYASLTIPNGFVGSYQLKAAFAGASRYLASASPLIPVHINQPTFITAADGLRTATVITSTGAIATTGKTAKVKYTGFLTTGSRFDTNVGQAGTFDFVVGNPVGAIKGFDEGVTGMNVGSTRVLVIPPALGYGAVARTGIPANSTLIFIVSLVAVV